METNGVPYGRRRPPPLSWQYLVLCRPTSVGDESARQDTLKRLLIEEESSYGVSYWYMVGFLAGSEEACMDVADFAEWVAGTARLTSSQRREAFRSLALAEAMASLDDEAFEYWGCAIEAAVTDRNSTIMPELEGSVEPPAPPNPSRSRLGSVAEVGHRRVVGMGCPHCANRDVILWGKANGLPRYRCRGCGRTFNGLTRRRWRDCAREKSGGSRPNP